MAVIRPFKAVRPSQEWKTRLQLFLMMFITRAEAKEVVKAKIRILSLLSTELKHSFQMMLIHMMREYI